MREALEWYAEQARLARLITSEGDPGRWALGEDGGKRAQAALSRKGSDAQTVGGGIAMEALRKIAAETTIGEPFKSENRIMSRDAMIELARTVLHPPSTTTHREPLPSDADDMGDGAGGVAKGGHNG